MKHEIDHDLEMDMAKLVARKAAEDYAERFARFDFRSRWVSDVRVELAFTVKGKTLDGSLTVEPRKVVVQMDVPLLFRVFQGKAIDIIEREVQKWIARAKSGELRMDTAASA